MDSDKRFIRVDSCNKKFDDEDIKYIRKDRVIEIWIEREIEG
jgi:hypothetical protein